METKTTDLIELIRGNLATLHKEILVIHKGLNGGNGARELGVAHVHLAQSIQALSFALKSSEPIYTETEASDFLKGLNSGTDS